MITLHSMLWLSVSSSWFPSARSPKRSVFPWGRFPIVKYSFSWLLKKGSIPYGNLMFTIKSHFDYGTVFADYVSGAAVFFSNTHHLRDWITLLWTKENGIQKSMESARSTAKSIESHHELYVPIIVMEVHTLLHVPIPGQGQIISNEKSQYITHINRRIRHCKSQWKHSLLRNSLWKCSIHCKEWFMFKLTVMIMIQFVAMITHALLQTSIETVTHCKIWCKHSIHWKSL